MKRPGVFSKKTTLVGVLLLLGAISYNFLFASYNEEFYLDFLGALGLSLIIYRRALKYLGLFINIHFPVLKIGCLLLFI